MGGAYGFIFCMSYGIIAILVYLSLQKMQLQEIF